MENRFLPPQKDICKTFIAQDFIILGYAVLHLHKLHLGRIQSILGFVGWFDLGKKKEKRKPMDSGHFKHLQHMFGIKSSWGPWGLFPPEGLCGWAVYQGWERPLGLQGSGAGPC